MKPFLDTGFFVTLLVVTAGSRAAWQIARSFNVPLRLTHLQRFQVENRLLRESASTESLALRTAATGGLQRLHHYLDEMIFQPVGTSKRTVLGLVRCPAAPTNSSMPVKKAKSLVILA